MNYWILKTNKKFNPGPFTDWIKPGYEEEWETRRPIPRDFSKGDVGFIWESGRARRLIAWGTVTNPLLDDSNDVKIFKVRSSTGVIEGLPNIETLRELTIFKNASFLKSGAAGTIFRLTPEQGEYLASIFRINIQPVNETANRILNSNLTQSVLPESPKASDIDEPAKRHESTTYRILRDTNKAKKVKSLHHFKCQICGYTIVLPDGSYYAEAHHIRPLGNPHNGPDVMENIMCLCPNHHAEMDYGVCRIELKNLNLTSGHSISLEYLQYHNEFIFRQKP